MLFVHVKQPLPRHIHDRHHLPAVFISFADSRLVSWKRPKNSFVTERLHHGLHGPNLAPRNTALFYEEEDEDIEDEDDIVDDDDDSGMVMNADSTGDPEIKVD